MNPSPVHRFIHELRRRHVPQTAAVYAVAAWAAIVARPESPSPEVLFEGWFRPGITLITATGETRTRSFQYIPVPADRKRPQDRGGPDGGLDGAS